MSGIRINQEEQIYLKMAMICTEMKNMLGNLISSIEQINNSSSGGDEILPLLNNLRQTSPKAVNHLIQSIYVKLLGRTVYASKLKFQLDSLSKLQICYAHSGITITNLTVKEFEFFFDLKLLAFIFKEILNFLTNLSESNQVYIDSFDSDSHYVVSLIAPSNEGLKLAEVKNGGHCPLEMCYTILSFYDGNLWSDSSSDAGIKLFFSLPKIKNHE